MLLKLKLCMNHARRVRAERVLSFEPGLNVIAGPNGSGKSTILFAIRACDECEKTFEGSTHFHQFDAETMNPRTAAGANGMTGMVLRLRSLFSSHGEIMKDALSALPIRKGDCLLIDEPESGQDLDGILRIQQGFRALCQAEGQVIVASHHPAFWKGAHLVELGEGYTRRVRDKSREILGCPPENDDGNRRGVRPA